MKYQKTVNFLNNTPNQPSKIRTKNWIERNDEPREKYKVDNKLNLKLQC